MQFLNQLILISKIFFVDNRKESICIIFFKKSIRTIKMSYFNIFSGNICMLQKVVILKEIPAIVLHIFMQDILLAN